KTSVFRKTFQNAADTKSYCPMDEAWGMANEYLTIEVAEAAAFACAHVTAEEAAKLFEKSAMFHPHPTQMKTAVERIANRVAPCREEVDRNIREEERVPVNTRVLVASMDGVNVLLNEPGKKQGRPAERPKGDERKKNKASYKNATAGIISYYGDVREGEKCPQRLDCRYVSHMPEDRAETFKKKFEAEVDDAVAKCLTDIFKVVLCDGARGIWNYIDNEERFAGFEKLIDYWHAVEHLSLAAEALFGKGTDEAEAWYQKNLKRLKEEERGAQCVLDSMDYYGKTRNLSSGRRKDLKTQRTFFARNKHRMAYADFRRRGLPIGSGPVEAACKSLVKARLCRSGMRWSRAGGQRILDLRTYVKSNRWDAFWTEYKKLKTAV
ncbi:MAG TPA: hypothetical protein VLA51_11475, partial [Paracoccaceae bacterium]|nr:hypothetical protein [Paracoccaceae bacterium]